MFRRHCSAFGVLALAAGALLAGSGRASAQHQGYYYANGYWYVYDTYVHGFNPGYYAQPRRVSPHGVDPGHFTGYAALGPYYNPPPRTSPGSSGTYSYPWTPPRSSPGPAQQTAGVSLARPNAAPAYIEVELPAGAELWFGDTKTKQTGPSRQFVSPALPVGREYVYELRALWVEGGREVTQTREISVRGGEEVSVRFPAPSTGNGAP
jgi:uncharacterized protein (TIGR03000 family)